MTPYNYRKLKRKARRFWREWGVTKEEVECMIVWLAFLIMPMFIIMFFNILGF